MIMEDSIIFKPARASQHQELAVATYKSEPNQRAEPKHCMHAHIIMGNQCFKCCHGRMSPHYVYAFVM